MVNPCFSHFKDKSLYIKTAMDLCSLHFGFSSLKDHQFKCIDSLWDNTSAFILTPTGSGKSLCYILPALMSRGLSIVISPLISLMDDQVKKLKSKSIKAECLHSSLSKTQKKEVLTKLRNSSVKILYVSVERFVTPSFIHFIKNYNTVSVIALDEAHCIADWKFFRPSYLKLGTSLKSFPNTTLIFLTATATKSKLQAILDISCVSNSSMIITNSIRENLIIKTFFAHSYEDKITLLIEYLKKQSGPGIIYTITRDEVEHLHLILSRLNIRSHKYHGGLSSCEKNTSLDYFLQEQSPLIIATKAFGMGIDKPDIRFVFHASCPSSMEDYFQEIGRAGRDHKASNTYLFYSKQDILIHKYMFDLNFPLPHYITTIYRLSLDFLNKSPLLKKTLISKIKATIKARSSIGIENTIDILLRFHQISIGEDSLLYPGSISNYSIKEVTKIIVKEKQEQLKKLKTIIHYINTTNQSLKDKIYFKYFNLN